MIVEEKKKKEDKNDRKKCNCGNDGQDVYITLENDVQCSLCDGILDTDV